MKKLLLIVMVAAHFVAFGQNKKKSIPPPPEKVTKQKAQKSSYRRIFEDNMMLALQWKMEVKDSVVIANEDGVIYKIYLEFQSDKELRPYKKQPDTSAPRVIYSVEKGTKLDKSLTPRTHYFDLVDYPWISEPVKIVDDNVELTSDETKEKQIFKIFLDKDKKNIIEPQDSKTKKELFSTEDFYPPTISI